MTIWPFEREGRLKGGAWGLSLYRDRVPLLMSEGSNGAARPMWEDDATSTLPHQAHGRAGHCTDPFAFGTRHLGHGDYLNGGTEETSFDQEDVLSLQVSFRDDHAC